MSLRDLTGRLVRTLSRAVRTPRPVAGPSAPAHLDPRAPTTDHPVRDLGLPNLEYAPRRDGAADPGDVVWARVPDEDGPAPGKGRPVLILARTDGRLVGLVLTSHDHDHDAADEARWGRFWMDVGAAGWDRRRRPSEVRLDRVLSLPVSGIRREGGAPSEAVFVWVAARFRELHSPGRPDTRPGSCPASRGTHSGRRRDVVPGPPRR